jgi:serine/threonine protein phosphatase PrpC
MPLLEVESLDTRPDRETFSSVEPLRLLVGIGLDAGIARKDMPNEDNLFAIQGMRPTNAGPEPVGLFIVADGMGGHAHGQEASKLAVHAVSDAIVPTLMRQVDNDEVFSDLLKDGVHRANLAIYQRNREQEHMMGTTLTAVLMVARTAYVVNVGDSRTYLYRPAQGMQQITRDHSIVARLVEDGAITREDIYTHPKRNQIYRCLGEGATVKVDFSVRALQADDVLVLCSDGLWEMVHDDEMESIIASSASYPSQLSKLLIQAALMRGGADNISVIVACIAQTEVD